MTTLGLGQKILQGLRFSVKKPKADSGAMPRVRFGRAFGCRVTTEKTCCVPRSTLCNKGELH